MGQEISSSHFTKHDFRRFNRHLCRETALLEAWFDEQRFSADPSIAGFELEAWLIDQEGWPAPINQPYLERLNDPLVVPELSVFNVEFNTPERPLRGAALSQMGESLTALWGRCEAVAGEFGGRLGMFGILPTVREQDLTLDAMSRMVRYRALNEQILRMRQGRPMQLNIQGVDILRTEHRDVMLEAATTSFQIHLQVKQSDATAFFNAALVLSAPLAAATANSPFLFGRDLWDETRIPLFEQAVAVGGDLQGDDSAYRRVTFGSGYLERSMLELFQENLNHYPPLLPTTNEQPPEKLSHVRLHNGTIWRWNRPLIGFDKDGTPHLRIEHRVMPAGPSIPDLIANAALFYGLAHVFGRMNIDFAQALPFVSCRDNFYAAARDGLRAEISWLNDRRGSIKDLLLQELLPLARQGLQNLGIDKTDIDNCLGIVEARIATGRTGAWWQRAFVARHGQDMQALTAAYLERQNKGAPVHEWGFQC